MGFHRIVAHTQVCANYGAHAWDGEGECPQYWKFKGGSEYLLITLSTEALQSITLAGNLERLVLDKIKNKNIQYRNDYSEEYVIGWEIYGPNEPTHDERLIAEWDTSPQGIISPQTFQHQTRMGVTIMRDPNRITVVLDRLGQYWMNHPDLRLGQIVSNLSYDDSATINGDPFYLEDSDLIAILESKIASGKV